MPKLFGFPSRPLPGPKALPLVGPPMRFFRFLDDPLAAILSLRGRGDVVALVADNPALVVVFGPERFREVLGHPDLFQHDEEVFVGPEGSQLDKLRHAIVAVNGDVHRRHRMLFQPAFKRAALDGYAEETAAVTRAVLDRWPAEGRVRVDSLVRELALCVAVRCFYGMDVVGGATELGHLAAEMVETLTEPLTILTPYNLPGMPYRRAVRTAEALLDKLAELVEEKRARGPGERDALSMLVHSRDEAGVGLSDDELIAEATTLFIAGHETVAMTLTWTLFLLERHPAELDRVLDELETVLGDRAPTPMDFEALPVLDRAIKESMRLLPSVPTLFLRVCAEEAVVGGVTLPRRANVVCSPLAMHHDPDLYPEPRRFRPDRWVDLKPKPYCYLPYGAGPRTCTGARFAEQALRIVLPMVLRHRRFSAVPGADISRLTRANILLARHGVPMDLRPYDREQHPPPPIRGDIAELLELPA